MANVSRMDDHKAPAETARLTIGKESWDLAIRKGTIGPDVVDIHALYADTNRFTYDPGFTSTAACESKITFIDGDEGILLYRGYPIEQLAEHGDFLETCYLLLYGELPTRAEGRLRQSRHLHTMMHEQMSRFFTGLPPRRAPDGGDVRRGRRAVGLLSRLDWTSPTRTSAWSPPPDRQDADDRRDGLSSITSASRSFIR